MATAGLLFIGILLGYGAMGTGLFIQPDADKLLEIFFKEPFVLFIVLLIIWFTASMRVVTGRLLEYRYLNSLPLSSKRLCCYFFVQDLRRFRWVPLCVLVILVGLLTVAPMVYLCRVAMLTILSYGLVISLVLIAHLETGRNSRINYLYRLAPWRTLLSIAFFALLICTGLVVPQLISGVFFWPVVAVLVTVIFALLRLAQLRFERWRRQNRAFVSPEVRKDRRNVGRGRMSLLFDRISALNPWLGKNLLAALRRRQGGVLFLTALFIALSYLASMNNQLMHHRMYVLLAIAAIYSVFFAAQTIDRFASSEESTQIIYALPVSKSAWYGSIFFPALGWLTGIYTLFGALIAMYSLKLATYFWLQSLFIGVVVLILALNSALISFPDVKTGKKYFIYLILAMIVLSALFYKYHLLIMILMILFSLLRIFRVKLYRMAAS
ncbi:hypothetical protein JXO59_00260 [candidate division KSB1 bacterium]|nr:hypothetical protein [candidate division KSB1 bacterium]